ncbi:MAG TPA: DUF2884 family protein [Pseudoxanthomonas sp.]|jgi:hypothetical protein|nr:DUF2884 family protein [Pseudoxanthomonas sp.]
MKRTLLLIPLVLALAACKPETSVNSDNGTISYQGHGVLTLQSDGAPKATIAANGDLTVGGKPVALTPQQRQLSVAFYQELDGITQAGIAIGKQGAQLAGKAVGEAVRGVLGGDTDSIGTRVEAEAKKMEAQAKQICTHLSGLRAAQDALAAQVPEFQPYANIDQHDVDDCGKDQN